MISSRLSSWVFASAIAAMATSIMLAVLIIAGEEVPPLKGWLKATFYHHWLGKGALALMLFAAMTFVLQFVRSVPRLAAIIFLEAVIATLAALSIAGFFLLHLLKIV
jgi:hypothetical protein